MQKHFEKRLHLNNQIRASQIQVIDFDGKQLGILPTHEALRLANERALDLVEVSPTAQPPIAKIMDYGKYMYQKEKREREGRPGKSPAQEIKTVKIGFKTGAHDLLVRAEQAARFLQKGHRVKLELALRGREKSMADLGRTKLESFVKMISEPFLLEEQAKRSPSGFNLLIKPENKK